MILPKGSIIRLAAKAEYDPLNPGAATWHDVSEHNRKELSVEIERIEKTHRTANGSMRKWWIADKHTWGTSWDMLPHTSTFTIDNKWGGSEIEAFYNANPGDFWVSVRKPDASVTIANVVFKSFSKSVQKRGRYEFWTIDLSLEEV